MNTKDTTKFRLDKGYNWIPSGITLNSCSTVQIGCRYKDITNFSGESISKTRKINDHTWEISLPDRLVYISSKCYEKSLLDMGLDLDHYESLAPQAGSAFTRYNNWIMTSAHYGIKEKTYWHFAKEMGLHMLSDSGGFQLASGNAEWVDPIDVIDYYNVATDVGMALDIPPNPNWGIEEPYRVLAHVHKRNNEIFLDRKAPHVQLLNVGHGYNYDVFRNYVDTVIMDGFLGWGLGCRTDAGFIRNAATLYKDYGIKTWIHMLGLSSPKLVPALAWIGKRLQLTSDSSSHLQGGRCRCYWAQKLDGTYNVNTFLGNANGAGESLFSGTSLFCTCPICSIVGSNAVFLEKENTNISRISDLLSYHNMLSFKNYVNTWNAVAKQCDYEQFLKRVGIIYPENDTAFQLVRYAHLAFSEGVPKANADPMIKMLILDKEGEGFTAASHSKFTTGKSAVIDWGEPEEETKVETKSEEPEDWEGWDLRTTRHLCRYGNLEDKALVKAIKEINPDMISWWKARKKTGEDHDTKLIAKIPKGKEAKPDGTGHTYMPVTIRSQRLRLNHERHKDITEKQNNARIEQRLKIEQWECYINYMLSRGLSATSVASLNQWEILDQFPGSSDPDFVKNKIEHLKELGVYITELPMTTSDKISFTQKAREAMERHAKYKKDKAKKLRKAGTSKVEQDATPVVKKKKKKKVKA